MIVVGFQSQERKPQRSEFGAQPWTYYEQVTDLPIYPPNGSPIPESSKAKGLFRSLVKEVTH